MRSSLLFAICVLTSSVALACGAGPAAAPAPVSPAARASDVERYFPLEDGKIYHYETREGDSTGMLIAKVKRIDATHGELRMSNGSQKITLEPGGVMRDGGGYLLKLPLEAGNSWAGEHGGTTKIAAVDATVDVPAGRYSSCVRTVEDGGRSPGATYESTYCPGVGLVLLVAKAPGAEARAALKSYAMPVKIE